MVPFAAAVLAWQVWTISNIRPSTFQLAYWYVTWDHGFVRRGLLGEINQLFFRHDMLTGAHAMVWITGVVSALIPATLALALLRRGTTTTAALGWLILLSPFTVKGLFATARPDQLPIILVVVAAWGLSRQPRHPRLLLAAIGAAFAVAVLAHEGIVLTVAPWLLLMIVWFSRTLGWREMALRAAACFGLPALVTLVVAWRGAATSQQIKLIAGDTDGRIPYSTLSYLNDTLHDSVALVASMGAPSMGSMVLVGLVLWAVHLLAVGSMPGMRSWPPKPAALTLAAVVVPALALQLVITTDWQRWFALWGTMGLLCLALVLLTDDTVAAGRVSLPWTSRPLVAFVLAAVALFLVPHGAATGRYPCTLQYIPHEASYPYERALDVVLGTKGSYKSLGHCEKK